MLWIRAKRRGLVASIAATACFVLASPGFAASVVKKSNKDLAQEAEVIVQGKVASTQARKGDGAFIFTDVTLDVTAFVKSGDVTQKTFKFSTIGGTLDGRTFGFSGIVSYSVGDEVLLFLEAPNPKTGCRYTIGVAQGKFMIRRDDSGKVYLERELAGTQFSDAHGHLEPPSKSNEPKLLLDEFLKEIKGYLEKK